ncbi:MAG: hypothetical protein H6Q59_1990 [Firmicutes bacterium]|nr:hypothetical protein [Bacillota bacterium]
MIITKIEEKEKFKFRVSIDGEFAFLLYNKDLENYRLTDQMSLSQELYDTIIEKVVYPRATEKALSILKYMDRCEHELRMKLSKAEYTEEVIDHVIQYVKHYGYLDDERYATAYIKSRMNRKSKLMISSELQQKGVAKSLIQQVFEVEYREVEDEDGEDAESIAIRKAISKKTKNSESLSAEEKQKIIASLYRKGFDLSKIKQNL